MYKFHMPLFFILSGYLFSEKSSTRSFVKKKILGLYIPFVFWNLLTTLIKVAVGKNWYSGIKQCIKIILTLGKDGEVFGATWFLGALFVDSIIFKVLYELLKCRKHYILYLLSICAAIMYIGFIHTFPYMLSRTFILLFFYDVGYCYRKLIEKHEKKIFWMIVCALDFIVIAMNETVNMGKNEYSNPVLFALGAFAGSYVIIALSKILAAGGNKTMNHAIEICGRRSLDILIWQFVFFRIVIAFQIVLNGESLLGIRQYYPVYDASNGWWIVYLLVGLIVPLVWGHLLRQIPVVRKYHIE